MEGGLEYGSVATLEMDGEDFPGVSVQVRPVRRYPFGSATSHVVGTVGYMGWGVRGGEPVNLYEEKEASGFFWEPLASFLDRDAYERMERRGEFFRDLFGKTGVEKFCDRELKGVRGARIVERDRRHRLQRDLHVHPSVHGGCIMLTLDAELQKAAIRAFDLARFVLTPGCELRGAAVVLDVSTGAILATVSLPVFDANDLVPPVGKEAASAILRGKGRPLLNRAVSGLYPPGSTFKVVSALAGLEEGLVEPGEALECTGHFEVGNHTFRCWNRNGHGPLALEAALEQSCNVYFYKLGMELGDALRRWAEVWGFGAPSGLDLPGEKGGILPRGRGGDWVQQAIGQRMTATPLQVARLMAVVANGGRFIIPYIRRGGGVLPESQVPIVSPAALEAVRKGLVRVVSGENGTAKLPSLREVKAAGKTGTAETGRKIDGVETNDAWFAGFAPHDNPKVAVAVVIEDVRDGIHGGDVAAPVAGEILKAALAIMGE
ncbi:MAG: peptidoglycan D,D-transpeptidase FtsI family protein [Planctomycetota bacterium]